MPARIPAAALRQPLVELPRAAMLAYRARPAEKTAEVIRVAARAEAGEVVLTVSDAAGPIPEPLLAQVFVPFAPIRTKAPAGGLGLAECWQAVLATGAWATVTHAEGGVRAELRLDLAPGAAIQAAPEPVA